MQVVSDLIYVQLPFVRQFSNLILLVQLLINFTMKDDD